MNPTVYKWYAHALSNSRFFQSTQSSQWYRYAGLTCRRENGADQGVLESSQSFIFSDDGFVRQLIVTLSCFNELPAEIQYSGIACLQYANTLLNVVSYDGQNGEEKSKNTVSDAAQSTAL